MNTLALPQIGEVHGRSQLEAIVRSNACEEGRAIVLDLEAIRARFGERWASRRTAVWDHTERAILRCAGPGALYHRVNETHYLLAFPQESGAAALSAGLAILKGVLEHFLGQVSQADLLVRTASIEGDEVTLGLARPAEARTFGCGAPRWSRIEARPFKAAAPSFIAGHPELIVRIAEEQLFDLRANAVIGRRIAAMAYDKRLQRALTPQEAAALPTPSLWAIKAEVLEAGARLLDGRDAPVVVVPFLLQSFANSRLRLATTEMIQNLAKDHTSRLIFEIADVDGGTPVARLQEALGILRPLSRMVICRAQATHSTLEVLREAGVRGFAIGAQGIGAEGERLSAGLMAFGAAAKGVAPLRMATGLDDRSQLGICALAGYTHASLAAPADVAGSTPPA